MAIRLKLEPCFTCRFGITSDPKTFSLTLLGKIIRNIAAGNQALKHTKLEHTVMYGLLNFERGLTHQNFSLLICPHILPSLCISSFHYQSHISY